MKFLNINDFFRSDKNYCMFLNHICPPPQNGRLILPFTVGAYCWGAWLYFFVLQLFDVKRDLSYHLLWPYQSRKSTHAVGKSFFSGILLIFTLLKKRTGPFLILVPRIFCRLRKPSNLLDPALFQTHKIGASPLCKAKDKSATKKLSPQCYEQLNKVSRNQQGYLSM